MKYGCVSQTNVQHAAVWMSVPWRQPYLRQRPSAALSKKGGPSFQLHTLLIGVLSNTRF